MQAVGQLGLDLRDLIGRSSGLGHLVAHQFLGQLLLQGTLGHGALHGELIAVLIHTYRLKMAVGGDAVVHPHVHPFDFGVGIVPAGVVVDALGFPFRFLPDTEHVVLLSGEVSVGKSLTGEGVLQDLPLFLRDP